MDSASPAPKAAFAVAPFACSYCGCPNTDGVRQAAGACATCPDGGGAALCYACVANHASKAVFRGHACAPTVETSAAEALLARMGLAPTPPLACASHDGKPFVDLMCAECISARHPSFAANFCAECIKEHKSEYASHALTTRSSDVLLRTRMREAAQVPSTNLAAAFGAAAAGTEAGPGTGQSGGHGFTAGPCASAVASSPSALSVDEDGAYLLSLSRKPSEPLGISVARRNKAVADMLEKFDGLRDRQLRKAEEFYNEAIAAAKSIYRETVHDVLVKVEVKRAFLYEKLVTAHEQLLTASEVTSALAEVRARLRLGDKALRDQAYSLLCCSLYAVQAATVLEDHDVIAHAATLLERREVEVPKLLHAESDMASSLAEVSET
jgi:hypothetical protein